jgi:hypothetical protein
MSSPQFLAGRTIDPDFNTLKSPPKKSHHKSSSRRKQVIMMKKFFMKLLVVVAGLACLGAVQASVLSLSEWSKGSLSKSAAPVQPQLIAPAAFSAKETSGSAAEESEPSQLRVFIFGALMMVFIAGTRMQHD